MRQNNGQDNDKIFTNQTSDRGLISKIDKKLKKLDINTSNLIQFKDGI